MPDVHLRVMVPDDAAWVVEADRQAGDYARRQGFESVEKLAAELDEGRWSSDERWAWTVVGDGDPIGFALVRDLDLPDASVEIRISRDARGRGAGREALRQLADHHFSDAPRVQRITGRTHEQNAPMQRAFNAAGFRMEARYRDSFEQQDGTLAAEWGYALTRGDWEAGLHHHDDDGYFLQGRVFTVEVEDDEPTGPWVGTSVRFLQEGRRVLARYDGDVAGDGELAGILIRDVVSYRYVHENGDVTHRGGGRFRIQRRQDGRLELVDEWSDDHAGGGERRLVERG